MMNDTNTERVTICKGRRVRCANGEWITAPDITISKDVERQILEFKAYSRAYEGKEVQAV